jgi:hypothetical protein
MGDVLPRIIDIDDASDLATIDFNDVELAPRDVGPEEVRLRQFHSPASWPPAAVAEGDVVAYAGWPGALRKDSADLWDIDSSPYSMIGMPVRRAMSDQFTVQIDRSDIRLAFGRATEDEKDYDFRGMSGGPVFRRADLSYEFVGIIKEYHPPPYDVFAFASVEAIKSNGQLWHNTRR